MFGDRLSELVREALDELGQEVGLLEGLLSTAKNSQASLEDLVREEEPSAVVRKVSSFADSVHREADVGNSVVQSPVGSEEAADLGSPDSTGEGRYSKVEMALLNSELTYRDRLIYKVRVYAQANGGLVRPGEAAPVFRKLGLSKASERNLPGYMSKEMIKSGEFERVGEEGTGLYRWLHFTGDITGEVTDCGLREGYALEELFEREEVVV